MHLFSIALLLFMSVEGYSVLPLNSAS